MPNHCTNMLEVSGPPADLERFREAMDGGTFEDGSPNPLDFEKIIPMPPSVRDTEGLDSLVRHADRGTPFQDIPGDEVSRYVGESRGIRPGFQDASAVEAAYATLLENRRVHGHAGWHAWASERWGTKWTAYSQLPVASGCDDGVSWLLYEFTTAWSPPEPVIEAMSAAWPSLSFQLEWREEGGGDGYMSLGPDA